MVKEPAQLCDMMLGKAAKLAIGIGILGYTNERLGPRGFMNKSLFPEGQNL